MTVSTKVYDLTGNQTSNDGITIRWDAMTNAVTPASTAVSICAGTGAPTFTANKGTLYINLSGSTTNDRAYINTTGSTTWTAITTAA